MKRISLVLIAVFCLNLLLCAPVSAADYDLLMGDVIEDGALTAGDARIVLRASAGLEALSEEGRILADVDFDGAPSAGDARMVLRASAGLEKLDLFRHSHSMESNTVSGTCVDPSITSDVCKDCGTTVVTGYTPAPGHTWKPYVRIGDSHHRDCSVCGEIETAKCSLQVTVNQPATCTEDGLIVKSCVCGLSESTVLKGGHAYGSWTKQTDGSFKCTCANCGDVKLATKDVILNWFNGHVNKLKELPDEQQKIAIIRTTKSVSDAHDFDFGLLADLTIADLFEKELDTETLSYDTPVFNRKITHNNMPAITYDYISDLTAADVKKLDIALGQTVNVLAEIPASFEVTNENEDGTETTESYDISAYKNATPVKNAIKVSIAINDEIATKTGIKDGVNTYSYTSGGTPIAVSEETPLVMERFYGRGLPDLCNQFPKDGSNEENGMFIDCPSANSKGRVDWYFDSETLDPVACVYAVDFTLNQAVEMTSQLVSGTFKLDMTITYTYIYLFSNYYPG